MSFVLPNLLLSILRDLFLNLRFIFTHFLLLLLFRARGVLLCIFYFFFFGDFSLLVVLNARAILLNIASYVTIFILLRSILTFYRLFMQRIFVAG